MKVDLDQGHICAAEGRAGQADNYSVAEGV